MLKTLWGAFKMKTKIKYYYENECGVFEVTRTLCLKSLKDIAKEIQEIKTDIINKGNKPLKHEIIFA
jgi:hypothetical protein